jgi:P-type Mg2+ transporter
LEDKKEKDSLLLLINQFKSPIILIFIFTSILSLFLGQIGDALIIVTIVIISGLLGFWQEKGATDAINRLLDLVQLKTMVMREGQVKEINSEDIVPGDIILLQSGDNIPADSIIIESKDLFVNEGTLTGESYPAEKSVKVLPKDIPIREITNSIFMGTYVISGTAKALVIKTGTEYRARKNFRQVKAQVPRNGI